jgi:hypothetical protein
MNLNSILSILGSLASLAAIPLSVYLYLRSKEARVSRVRREVVRTLSYQIGEGRDLNVFTIVTVIRSRIRDEGVREGSISVEDVVEDLVAETIMEPMIDSERKSQILVNLSRLYHLGEISRFLERYSITADQLYRWTSEEHLEKKEYRVKEGALGPAEGVRPHKTHSVSTSFALISTVITSLLFVAYEKELAVIFRDFSRKVPVPEFFIGVISSLLAAVLTSLVLSIRGHWYGRSGKGKADDFRKPSNPAGRADD